MTIDNIALFRGLGAKMEFLNQRQKVIAQNIANADTPGYMPQDLRDANFRKTLEKVLDTDPSRVDIETTNKLHMPIPGDIDPAKEGKQKTVYEVAPVGNAVVMEEQLLNSNKTSTDYALMTNVYQKNITLMKMAIGN